MKKAKTPGHLILRCFCLIKWSLSNLVTLRFCAILFRSHALVFFCINFYSGLIKYKHTHSTSSENVWLIKQDNSTCVHSSGLTNTKLSIHAPLPSIISLWRGKMQLVDSNTSSPINTQILMQDSCLEVPKKPWKVGTLWFHFLTWSPSSFSL